MEKNILDVIRSLNYKSKDIFNVIASNMKIDFDFGHGGFLRRTKLPYSLIESLSDGCLSILELDLFLSKRCNASCPKCYCGDATADGELTLDQIKEIIRQAKKIGARVVYTPGAGEPTIDPKFLQIAKFIKEMDMNWVVYTNGIVFCNKKQCKKHTGMTPFQFAKAIKELGVTLIHKIWSTYPGLNDKLTGTRNKYSYAGFVVRGNDGRPRTVYAPKGLNLLRMAGFSPGKDLLLETLCTPANFKDVKENIIPFAEKFGFSLVLEPLILNGWAKKDTTSVLSEKQVEEIFPHLVDFGPRKLYTLVIDNRGFVHKSIGEVDLGNPMSDCRVVDEDGKVVDIFNLIHSNKGLVQNRHSEYVHC